MTRSGGWGAVRRGGRGRRPRGPGGEPVVTAGHWARQVNFRSARPVSSRMREVWRLLGTFSASWSALTGVNGHSTVACTGTTVPATAVRMVQASAAERIAAREHIDEMTEMSVSVGELPDRSPHPAAGRSPFPVCRSRRTGPDGCGRTAKTRRPRIGERPAAAVDGVLGTDAGRRGHEKTGERRAAAVRGDRRGPATGNGGTAEGDERGDDSQLTGEGPGVSGGRGRARGR